MQTWYVFRHGLAKQPTQPDTGYGKIIFSAEVLPEGWPTVRGLGQQMRTAPQGEFYCSPFVRCQQTATEVSRTTGMPFEIDERLGEMHDETIEQFKARVTEFIVEKQRSKAETIWVCTHGAVIAAMTHFFSEGDFQESQLIDYPAPAGSRVFSPFTQKLRVTEFEWQSPETKIWQSWAEKSRLTPFSFPAFQQVYRGFADTQLQLRLLGVWHGDELIAVLSTETKAGIAKLTGMSPLFGKETITDYGDLVIKPELAESTNLIQPIWLALRQHIQSLGIKKLQLENLRPDGFLHQPVASLITLDPREVAPYLLVPKDWETYLAQLDRKDRSELRRKFKRLDEAGPEYHFEQAATAENMAEFIRLHRASDPAKAAFMTEQMAGLFTQLSEAMYEGGWRWRLGFLSLAGKNVAAVAYFIRENGAILLYNSGYDPAYSQLSVGLLIKAKLLDIAWQHHCTEYDFLRGSERYKYDLGASTRQLYRADVSLE
jgi:CelD/BcsL family acetyltransferase involved in cellulose biosynthesis/broad specificity phosphatase PhoE